MLLAAGCLLVQMFRDGEDAKQNCTECDARDSGQLFGEEIDDGSSKQQQRNQSQADRDLYLAYVKVARNLPLAILRLGKTQHEHGQRLESEAPDDTEGVQGRQQINVATAGDDGKHLKKSDEIDDAVAGSKARVRLTEPCRHHAVFADAIEHAIGTHDGGVD